MQWKLMYVWNLGKNLKSAAGAEKAQKEWAVFVNLYFFRVIFTCFFFNFTYLVTRLGLCNRWLDFTQTVNMFMCLQRWIWINLKLMNWCQTERMNLKYVEINWNVIFSKIILILILKGKRAVPIQLYIFIIFMCLQSWIWINLKLMNWCQTERMNLKYVIINWNVIFFKNHSHLDSKRQKSSTRTERYIVPDFRYNVKYIY